MFTEDDLLSISALQHLAFCERQWGLMYLENIWSENPLTAEGRILHEQADEPGTESRVDLRIARGLGLRSLRLGLTGRADVVEFHRLAGELAQSNRPEKDREWVRLQDVQGYWKPVPVEYKHGKPKTDRCDEVQLCAQALCLEEMLEVSISAGAIYYGKPRRRTEVVFDSSLRRETESLAEKLHELTKAQKTPAAKYGKWCRSCSIESFCLPKATSAKRTIRRYLDQTISSDEIGEKDAGSSPWKERRNL